MLTFRNPLRKLHTARFIIKGATYGLLPTIILALYLNYQCNADNCTDSLLFLLKAAIKTTAVAGVPVGGYFGYQMSQKLVRDDLAAMFAAEEKEHTTFIEMVKAIPSSFFGCPSKAETELAAMFAAEGKLLAFEETSTSEEEEESQQTNAGLLSYAAPVTAAASAFFGRFFGYSSKEAPTGADALVTDERKEKSLRGPGLV